MHDKGRPESFIPSKFSNNNGLRDRTGFEVGKVGYIRICLFLLRKRTLHRGLHGIYVNVFYNLFILWTNWQFPCNGLIIDMIYPSS